MEIYVYYIEESRDIFSNYGHELIIIYYIFYKVLLQLQGTLVAPTRDAWKGDDKWIQFSYVDGLIINGGGLIDGQGASWWESCINCDRPTVR